MPLLPSDIDRDRLASTAGVAACAVLALVALWLLVRLMRALVPVDDAALAVPRAQDLRSGAPSVPAPRSIAQAHLFGQAVAPVTGPSTTSLILRGTLAEADPAAGIAVIADAGNGEHSVRVGEDVGAGVRLVAVYPDHVVVDRGGARESLVLPRDTQLTPTDVVRPTPARASSRAADARDTASAKPAKAGAPATWQQKIEQLKRDPAELARRVQVVPVLDGTRLRGVRLAAGSDASLLDQLGLQPGDLVTAVNGTPIDSVERGQQILAGLGSAGSVRVTVVRGGRPTEITVGLR